MRCTAMRCDAIHCDALRCVAMHCDALRCTAMHCDAMRCTAMHCDALRCAAMRCDALRCIAMHCDAMHCDALRCTAMHCDALRCDAMRCTAMHCDAMHCDALRCDTMRCDALRCTAMRCDALGCDPMHCDALRFTAMRCDALRLHGGCITHGPLKAIVGISGDWRRRTAACNDLRSAFLSAFAAEATKLACLVDARRDASGGSPLPPWSMPATADSLRAMAGWIDELKASRLDASWGVMDNDDSRVGKAVEKLLDESAAARPDCSEVGRAKPHAQTIVVRPQYQTAAIVPDARPASASLMACL